MKGLGVYSIAEEATWDQRARALILGSRYPYLLPHVPPTRVQYPYLNDKFTLQQYTDEKVAPLRANRRAVHLFYSTRTNIPRLTVGTSALMVRPEETEIKL